MKNLKFYLIVFTTIFLIGCGNEDSVAEDSIAEDPRANGKARLAEIEFALGHITNEESECIANVFSDYFDDDEEWDALVALMEYTPEEQYEIGLNVLDATEEEQKMLDVSLKSLGAISNINSECDIDYWAIAVKRMPDLLDY